MATSGFELDVFRDFLEEAGAAGELAKDEKSFQAAYEAFRALDPKAFQAALQKAVLVPRCHLLCRWIRSKECIFLCLELCGPPKPLDHAPDPRALAEAIVRITSDKAALEKLVQAVEKRDRSLFEQLVGAYKLGPVCHLFCHWVCYVWYRLVCRWICAPLTDKRPDLRAELLAAGQALRVLLEHKEAFDQAVAASNAGDAEKLGAAIRQAGLLPLCHFICEWFCSWRCTLVCLTVCRQLPLPVFDNPIKEAREFAQAVQQLVQQDAAAAQLAAAVGAGDAKTYASIIDRLKLQRYCIQLCHWICGLRCRRFCILVCPPPDTIPLFTHVGAYRVDPMWGDFQPDGTTTAGRYAFTRTIPLRGIMPDGTAGEAYEYHFRIAQYATLGPPAVLGGTQDVVTSMIPMTVTGELEFWYWNAALTSWLVASADYYVNNPGATVSIPQQIGLPLVVSVNKDVKAGGWIEVPRENNLVAGGVGRFIPNGNLANLDTRKLIDEPFDLRVPAPGVHAGDAVPAGKKSAKPVYEIFFEARKVIGGASVSSNNLDRIAFCDTAYTYTRHIEWAGGDVTTKGVCSLDIAELIAPGATGCDRLHGHIHATYTAYHSYLQSVGIWFEGNSIPATLPTSGAPFGPLPGGADEVDSPAGGHDFDISGLKPCAYILWMSTTVGLTEGWGLISDATDSDHIAFCVR